MTTHLLVHRVILLMLPPSKAQLTSLSELVHSGLNIANYKTQQMTNSPILAVRFQFKEIPHWSVLQTKDQEEIKVKPIVLRLHLTFRHHHRQQ